MGYNKAYTADTVYSVSYTRNLRYYNSDGSVAGSISAKEIMNMQYNFNYTNSGTTYKVQKDSKNNMYVDIPIATASSYGTVKLASGLTSLVTPNNATSTANRSYYVVKNSDNTLIVNVPWTRSDVIPTPSSSQEGTLLYVKDADSETLAWGYREFQKSSTTSLGYHNYTSGSMTTISSSKVRLYTISVTSLSTSCNIYASTSSTYTTSLSSSVRAMATAMYVGEIISITFIARSNETLYVGGGYFSSGYITYWENNI